MQNGVRKAGSSVVLSPEQDTLPVPRAAAPRAGTWEALRHMATAS